MGGPEKGRVRIGQFVGLNQAVIFKFMESMG